MLDFPNELRSRKEIYYEQRRKGRQELSDFGGGRQVVMEA
jgi:hypothetical protein